MREPDPESAWPRPAEGRNHRTWNGQVRLLADGRIAGLRDVFTSFNEPSGSIPPEVTALTGITAEMVAGQRIDATAVSSFVADAVIVIAHNAGFDRKFAERYWPTFERIAWGCSATEVEWRNTVSKVRAWATS